MKPNSSPTPHGMSLVNMAARQRMLSQRLTLQIVLAAQGNAERLAAAQESLNLFVRSQAQLVETARQLHNGDGKILKEVYFENGKVAHTVDQFIRSAQAALELAQSNSPDTDFAVNRLVSQIDGVLEALNLATSAFDRISTDKEVAIMKELKGIVSDIQSVAREAKVVSFNAQVIAARAGSVGREFAVVANTLVSISGVVDTLAKKGLTLVAR